MSNPAPAAETTSQAAPAETVSTTTAASTTTAPATTPENATPEPAAAATTTPESTTATTTTPATTTPEPPAVPEKYELKVPEGSTLDANAVAEVEAYAKEHKLSNTAAQKLLENQSTAVSKFAQNQLEQYETKKAEWANASKTDKEIGGDKFNENVELAHRALSAFGSEELKKQLDATGFGNHPEIIRAFSKIGRAMAEDKMVTVGTQQPVSRASKLYDHPTSNQK